MNSKKIRRVIKILKVLFKETKKDLNIFLRRGKIPLILKGVTPLILKTIPIITMFVVIVSIFVIANPFLGMSDTEYETWLSIKETTNSPLNSFEILLTQESETDIESTENIVTTTTTTKKSIEKEVRIPMITTIPTTKITNNTTDSKTQWKSLGIYKITAYCPCSKCCGRYAYNRPEDDNGEPIIKTASGAIAKSNYTVGVNPNVIPFGSVLLIDGKEYVAEDTGNFSGKLIDIYFDTHEEAESFGMKYEEIYILK